MNLRTIALILVALSAACLSRAADGYASIPDVEVHDQTGATLHFKRDLLQGKAVAIDFIFTSCQGICPQLGANSVLIARQIAKAADPRLRIISVSIDPQTDTPEKLREWSAAFGDAPNWTLVTGGTHEINQLLKAFQVYTPDRNLHSGAILLGNPTTGEWTQTSGTANPQSVVHALQALAPAPVSTAASYFPDNTLIDQDGQPKRFYSDLVKGRVVIINSMFADCGAACPIMAERLAKVQSMLGDRVGRDIFLLSITVDPVSDTPKKLKEYAERVGARPGWEFLTGPKADVDEVLKKLGQYVDVRESHSNLLIVGNEPTGLWKKAFGLAPVDQIEQVVESVANDGR